MKAEHIDPSEAVKFMDAVKAKRAFPIHWGTFPLTSEPVFEPRNKLVAAMREAGRCVVIPPFYYNLQPGEGEEMVTKSSLSRGRITEKYFNMKRTKR